MPLSQAHDRNLLHLRDITVRGYQRSDGCFDVEGHLVDTKPYSYPSEEHGAVQAGEPVHEMWMRMTLTEDLSIVSCEAATDHGPYGVCPMAAPNFAALAGLTIRSGFLRAAAERVGGTKGCTHLREMLQQMATIAFQTVVAARARRQAVSGSGGDGGSVDTDARPLLNSCYAYGSNSPVVRRRWPELYTGPADSALAG